MRHIKPGLLPKVIIAILLGILFSYILPLWAVRIFVTINSIFSNYLGFIIPLIILGLVIPGISELGKGAGKLLLMTTLIAYSSTLISGFFSYFTTKFSLPLIMEKSSILSSADLMNVAAISPYFTIEMHPVMDVTAALVLSFILGLSLTVIKGDGLRKVVLEFRDVIEFVIKKSIIPLLPLFIFGIFLKIAVEGQVPVVLGLFFKVIIIIFAMHVMLLLFQYTTAWLVSGKNPFKALYNMMPAYMTALGTQSSAATIPVTLAQTKKNGVNPDLAGFVVPLCATIHLAGSILKIVACAYSIMWFMDMPSGIGLFAGFIFMLGIIMIAAPGVPGGAIMASIAILQSMLGFDQTLIGLMIALYITMDSFGTACNVTGDGAIALIINKLYKKKVI
jgi:Na+/H+-dicarboxylate symporter